MKLKQFFEDSKQWNHATYTEANIRQLWNEINNVSFNGELTEPKIFIEDDLSHLVDKNTYNEIKKIDKDAEIMGYCDEDPDTKDLVLLIWNGIEDPKELMQVVAHEMVHQALAEKYGYDRMRKLGHGPEFMEYKNDIKKYHNAELYGATYD